MVRPCRKIRAPPSILFYLPHVEQTRRLIAIGEIRGKRNSGEARSLPFRASTRRFERKMKKERKKGARTKRVGEITRKNNRTEKESESLATRVYIRNRLSRTLFVFTVCIYRTNRCSIVLIYYLAKSLYYLYNV